MNYTICLHKWLIFRYCDDMNSRAAAAKIILHVIVEKHSLDSAFLTFPLTSYTNVDQRFIHELCYGALRWYEQLLYVSNLLLHKPLERKHYDVLCVLLIGLYQLMHLDIPPYAAISSTVDAVKTLKKPWASGLINKLLRLFLEKKSKLFEKIHQAASAQYSHPDWLIQKIKKDWPKHWEALLMANNIPAPMVIRINPQQTTVLEYQHALQASNIIAEPISGLPFALQLQHPVRVNELPNFFNGACYVQDQAGQYTALLLELEKNQIILDACAAPGSKMTDILLTEPGIKQLVALDKNPERLGKIKENVTRLQLSHQNIRLILADATKPTTWWSGETFDRILVDAPCSATGVIRRHPDIKLLREETDIREQAKQQYALLNALWPLLKPQGLLLYSTCSVLQEENDGIIGAFLKKNGDAESRSLTISVGIKLTWGHQILPTSNGPDGFYYALLKKK